MRPRALAAGAFAAGVLAGLVLPHLGGKRVTVDADALDIVLTRYWDTVHGHGAPADLARPGVREAAAALTAALWVSGPPRGHHLHLMPPENS